MNMRMRKPLLALGTAGLMLLSACGGSGSSNGSAASDKPSVDISKAGDTGQAQDPTRQGPVEIAGAQTGGTMKLISGLNTMDPSEAYYTNTSAILGALVTRSLTQYAYDPATNSVTLVPDLATDLGTPNADFTEWKFTIRDGIKYENGDPVTAEDVKFGMERTMDLSTFAESPGFYSAEYFAGGDKYDGPYSSKGKKTLDSIAVDGMTITITMAKPFPDMPYWGAFPANGPIPQGNVSDPAKYRLHPWATGPYMFDKYTPEKSLTLVRNPNWDPATDPGRTAYPDGYDFEFDVASEKIDQTLFNDQGAAKNTFSYDDVLAPDLRKFQNQAPDRLITGASPCTAYWAPDYRKITDIKVRQALGWAYPYKGANLAAGLIEGISRIYGSELLPPGTPGRVEYDNLEGHTPGQTDAAKAKALLEEAGAVGQEISWLYATDDPNSVKAKDTVAAALKEAGFTPKPVPTTVAEFSTVRNDPNAKINVRSAGWCADWPSGGSWFPVLLKTTNIDKVGLQQNLSAFSEKAIDDKINEILASPIDTQAAAWGELDKQIAQEYFPLMVTGYYGVAMMKGSNVEGMYNDLVFGMPTLKNMWLKQG
jgi:peptide/nickel transport system substrate-binding protein